MLHGTHIQHFRCCSDISTAIDKVTYFVLSLLSALTEKFQYKLIDCDFMCEMTAFKDPLLAL